MLSEKGGVRRRSATVELFEQFNAIKAMTSFLKNRPAVGTTLAAMGVFIGMQAASAAVSVIFRICFQNPQTSGLVSMFFMILIMLFTPLARKMVIRFGKKELSVIGSICCIAGDLLLFAARASPLFLRATPASA